MSSMRWRSSATVLGLSTRTASHSAAYVWRVGESLQNFGCLAPCGWRPRREFDESLFLESTFGPALGIKAKDAPCRLKSGRRRGLEPSRRQSADRAETAPRAPLLGAVMLLLLWAAEPLEALSALADHASPPTVVFV